MVFFTNDAHPKSQNANISLGELYNLMEKEDPEIKLPDFQREYVWSKKQQEKYLETLSKNMPIFGPVINIDTDTGIQWIMDGQNRILTIVKFQKGEIRYKGKLFTDLPVNEQRKFKNMKLSYTETQDWSEEQCQDFFMRIQEGVKLKDGELIHARSNNELTISINDILVQYDTVLKNTSSEGGFGLSKKDILRYGHFEILGTLIHMVRTNEFPSKPGKTAMEECDKWEDENTPTRSQRDNAILETKRLLNKYSQIIRNVAKLKDGITKSTHLRLLYFIYKNNIYKQEMNENIYIRIDSLLNQVLNKDNPVFEQIKQLSGYNDKEIYNKYLMIYNS